MKGQVCWMICAVIALVVIGFPAALLIPFFIYQGENDVLLTPGLARAYFNDVVAPVKRMVLISDAGHFAPFLQPKQFLDDLLIHVRPLSPPPSVRSAQLV